MFQRQQTVFMAFTVVLIAASYFMPYGEVGELPLGSYGVKRDGAYLPEINTYWFHIPFFLVFMLMLVGMFQFKNRPRQMAIVRSTFILFAVGFGLLAFYIRQATTVLASEFTPGISVFLPFAAMITTWLALRGIRKDEQLVRSVDRIR